MQINVTLKNETLTADTFKDLRNYLQKIDYNKIPWSDVKRVIIIDSRCSYNLEDIKKLLTHSTMRNLTEINIINPDERLCTINGLLYSRNKRRLYLCPRGITGTLKIPDGTDTICEVSCSDCNFTKVIIPDSVKRVEGYAFHRAYGLEEIDGGKNIERIMPYAFYGCAYIKNFPFSSKLKSIGNAAFTNTALKEISLPDGLVSVGDQAFNTIRTENGYMVEVHKGDMYDVCIPDSLKYIGHSAFANASNVYTKRIDKKLISACERSGNLKHCHKCNTWRLKIGDRPEIILPKMISNIKAVMQKINVFFNEKNDIPPELYMYSPDSTGLSAAIEQCKLYPSAKLKSFITRNAKIIMLNIMLEENGEQMMIDFIKSGVFTDAALKKILSELEKSENPQNTAVLKAYILNTMNHKKKSFSL